MVITIDEAANGADNVLYAHQYNYYTRFYENRRQN